MFFKPIEETLNRLKNSNPQNHEIKPPNLNQNRFVNHYIDTSTLLKQSKPQINDTTTHNLSISNFCLDTQHHNLTKATETHYQDTPKPNSFKISFSSMKTTLNLQLSRKFPYNESIPHKSAQNAFLNPRETLLLHQHPQINHDNKI